MDIEEVSTINLIFFKSEFQKVEALVKQILLGLLRYLTFYYLHYQQPKSISKIKEEQNGVVPNLIKELSLKII